MPEIGEDLVDFQEQAGAVFGEGSASPLSYGNNSRALFSVEEDAAVVDASEWTRLRVAGPDAEAFLHGQLSVDVRRMTSGTGREACLLTPQGRVVDLLLLLRMETGFMIVCSPDMGSEVKNHLEKHIFMSDDVAVRSVSAGGRLRMRFVTLSWERCSSPDCITQSSTLLVATSRGHSPDQGHIWQYDHAAAHGTQEQRHHVHDAAAAWHAWR